MIWVFYGLAVLALAVVLIGLGVQWLKTSQKPQQRAQVAWIGFGVLIGPLEFICLRMFPVILNFEPATRQLVT